MTNEFSNSENLFPAYNQHEVVEKLETGFKKLNDKFINLLEENQRIKQHNKNLQEENQDILRINLELNEKNQEISRNNLESNKKYQEISRNNSNLIRINNDLKVKLQARDKQIEKLQNDLNLEKQKNKEIQRLEVISQNLEKNLKILEVDEIDINTINVFKENNEQTNCNINKNPTTALNYSKGMW
jgi:chromosome segregation ATPase